MSSATPSRKSSLSPAGLRRSQRNSLEHFPRRTCESRKERHVADCSESLPFEILASRLRAFLAHKIHSKRECITLTSVFTFSLFSSIIASRLTAARRPSSPTGRLAYADADYSSAERISDSAERMEI